MKIYGDKNVNLNYFNQAYNNCLDLICVGNNDLRNKIHKRVLEKLNRVFVTSKEEGNLKKPYEGLTNARLSEDKIKSSDKDVIKEINITIFDPGFYTTSNSSKIVLHTETHEIFHMLSAIIPGIMKANKNVIREGNIIFYNGMGFYCSVDNNQRTTYGEMFNETLTDMLATIALNSFNKSFENEVCANHVFRKNYNNWKESKSSYTFFTSMTRLAIAAFSNDPDVDFDDMITNEKNIFFSRTKGRNGQVMMKNDLLYGYIANPLHTRKAFDDIVGKGCFDTFNKNIDAIFNCALKDGTIKSDHIRSYMKIIPSFLNLKIKKYKEQGIFNEEDCRKITNNFNKVWNEVSKEYGVYFTSREISEFNNYKKVNLNFISK